MLLISILFSQTMINPNINLNQLYHLMNHQQARNRTQLHDKFPFDGQQDIEKLIKHPGSREILACLKKDPQKGEINKLILNYYSELLQICVCQEEKSVCAKIVKNGETIVQCFDCRADPSCIICMDCFKNGNHKGHRVIFKKAGGGCCDCGDVEAWKQQGFCSKHTGKTSQVQVSTQERNLSNCILLQLYSILCWLKLSKNKLFSQFLVQCIRFLQRMVGISIKGIKLISIFLEEKIPQKMVLSSKLPPTPFQQILNANFIDQHQLQFWEKLLIEMFPYYPFKQQLIANYIKCFSTLYASERTQGQSIACQIITSYKLVQEYSQSKGAVPIIIEKSNNISDVYHKTKIMTYDLNRINSLQGEAPLKYWTLVIKHGIRSMFGYYETLKQFARKQKKAGQRIQEQKRRKKKRSKLGNLPQELQVDKMQTQEDTSFSLVDFLQRHHQIIEVEYTILQQIIQILPILSHNQHLMLELIRSLFVLLIADINNGDDLLIFRPYDRLLGVALFFYARQTPFILSNPKMRENIRQKVNLSQVQWEQYLSLIQKRMLQTFGFFSHLLTCQTQQYHHTFYTYLMLYASKYCLLGHSDILLLRELIFLGAPQMKIDFATAAKLDRIEPSNKWSLKALSGIVSELGLLYIGSYSQVYISFYSEKSDSPQWLINQAKRAISKFITAEGGSITLQRAQQFSNTFLFKDDDDLKKYLKELCQFNKQKKVFELLPAFIDKEPINLKDFKFRTKIENQSKEGLNPRYTLQLIDKANKMLFTNVWNQKNVESLCQILLQINEDVQKTKENAELIEYYSIPCKLLYLLKENEVLTNLYASLSDLVLTFEVPNQVKKELGVLSHFLSSPLEEASANQESVNQQRDQLRLKKLKKLQELKKKNIQNVQKIKAKHAIEAQEEDQTNRADQCLICRKTGGNLVWVSKLSIRNLEKIFQLGVGTLTLSFTSCYHAFDFECIMKNAIKKSTHEFLFRCPVCRSLGNIFVSIANKQNVQENMTVQASLERIMHVAMTIRQYTTFNIYEQIFKSFYHLILLGYAEPQYVRQRRMRLYKQIVSILCNKKLRDHIKQIESKLQKNEIVLEPKSGASKMPAVNLHHQAVNLPGLDYLDDDSDYDSDEQQFEDMIEQIMHKNGDNYHKQPKKTKKIVQKKQFQPNNKPTPLFCYVLRRILTHILRVIDQQNQMLVEKPQKEEMQIQKPSVQKTQQMTEEIKTEELSQYQSYHPEPWAVALLDELLDEKILENDIELVPHTLLKTIDLPQRFYWDLTDSTCHQCDNVCSDLFVCLLCSWKGCLNNCINSGLKGHNMKYHGQSGAFLRLKDANAYIIGPGELSKVGCMYLNEWGEEFNQSGDWNKYILQASVIKKVVEMLIKNE